MKTRKLQLSMLLMLLVVFGFSSVKAQNTMVINNTTALPSSVVEIQMAINNADAFVAYQLDIPLPAGFTYVNASLTLTPARITNHVISGNVVAGNILRVVSHSPTNAAYLGNSGTIMTFQVNAPATTGDYTFNIVDGYIASAAGTNIISGTTSGTITIAKGTPTIDTWPTAAAITYGAQLSTATLSGGAASFGGSPVTGTFAYINPTLVPNAGTYVASVRFTPTNTTLYNTVDGTINVTVNQRAITITADAKTKVYGNTDPALTYQVTSGSLVTGDSWTGALTRVAGENIGPYAINQGTVNVTPTPGNYNITYVSANLTITARPITINAEAKTKVYGNADPALTYTLTGTLAAGDSWTGALSRVAGENIGPYAIQQGTLTITPGIANYTVTYNSANLTITARPITINAEAKTKVYGETDPALTYTVSGTLASGDSFTGALSRVAGENVGPYAIQQGTLTITPGIANYTVTYNQANLTITSRAITVNAEAKTKVYGEADPALTYTLSGTLAGGDSFTGALSRVAGENVGSYAIQQGTLAITPGGANYTLTYNSANLTITVRAITVTAEAKTKVYGEADPALTYTVTGTLSGGDSWTGELTRVAGENVGPYAIQQGSLNIAPTPGNYNITYVGANLTITAKGLTVTANSFLKPLGTDYTFTGTEFSTAGLVGADEVTSATITSTGSGAAAVVGTYPILISNAVGTGLANYSITYVDGVLTVTELIQLSLTGLAANNKVYDGTSAATISSYGTLTGVEGGDDVTLVTTGATASFASKIVGNGRTVTVTGLTLTGADADKYVIGNQTTTANITHKDLTLFDFTAANKVYDGTTTVTGTGFSNDRIAGDVVTFTFTAAFENANVGNGKTVNYTGIAISGGADAGNYNLVTTSGTATANITPRALNITADAKTKIYGADDPALTYVSAGLLGGDEITGSLTRQPGENVAVYLILQGTLDAGSNYTITYTGANFTITKRNLNIVADDIFKVAGNEYVFLGTEFTTGTLYFTDEITSVTLTSTGSEAAAAPGTYPIIPSNAVGSANLVDNYNINYVNGTMTVTDKIGLTIDGLTAQNKEYDGNNEAEIDNFGTLVGVEVGDDVTLVTDVAVATFADVNVNDDIIVSVVGITLGGADADKYVLAPIQYTSANIYAKELTIGGTFTAEDKEFDGNTDAVIETNNLELIGIVGIDDVVLVNVVAEFATSVPGNDILVSIVSADIDGADISNYTLSLVGAPTTTANITPLAGQNEVIVIINPVDAGSVTGAGFYDEAALVTLEASANSGYVFANWTIDGTVVGTSTTYSFNMPAEDITVTANFEEILYNVAVEISPVGAGTVTGEGEYAFDEEVTVEATANTGYTFIGWELNSSIVETNSIYTFNMPAEDVALVAVFEINVFTLTVVANPAAGGTVTGSGDYEFGASVPVTATSSEGYNFVNWTVGATVVSTSASFNYTMPNNNVTLTANFEVIPDPTYTLTVVADPVEGGTATGGGEFEAGVEVTVNATANANFTFDGWYLGGSLVSTDDEFTFNMPAENITLVAKFGTVSINDPSIFSISVYPNPSRGNINITSDRIITDVKVFDMIGKVVFTIQPDAEVVDLMLTVEPGMYFVRIYTEDGQKTIKLQITK